MSIYIYICICIYIYIYVYTYFKGNFPGFKAFKGDFLGRNW